ncbi:F-box domain containing protein [Ophiocordyceps sinensis CO18]|uniref:F-box domain containing protein n=1 Tax=Ophiocordyceps sinensis (strain Co18 / CGMCC 3.14243) TaxID=911162 RepID=T5ABL5_OPHSC|nr:F-box domain containing protein [Ophiocordyceps sinensis CO18]
MASSGRLQGWNQLPNEILLHILRYLAPCHIIKLRLVSRKLRNFCLDDELWKRRCLGDSPWYHLLQSRRRALSRAPLKSADGASQTTLLLAPAGAGIHESASRSRRRHLEHAPRHRRWQERQDMANSAVLTALS